MPRTAPQRRQVATYTLAAGLVLLAAPLRAEPPGSSAPRPEGLPPTSHRYALWADLDPVHHRVHARQRIRFRNTSRALLHALQLHLYPNAFRDEGTVFMRESGGRLRRQDAEGFGHIALEDLRVDGQDRLAAAQDELLEGDRSQLRVPLTTPLPPGESLVIEVEFEVQLPPVFARSGYAGEFHAVAQWFPKLAKLEPDGRWAGFPYHARGEFYADFADYSLQIRAPGAYVVAASGQRTERRREGAYVVHRFEAPAVHDVAWVAYPHFREHVLHTAGVEVQVLYPPGYEQALDEHLTTLRTGLAHFGERLGPYPYPTLTVVIPPRGAEGAAGMEYPGLFMTGGPWFSVPGLHAGAYVTAHELAHQWFQGLLASDEVRWPALDEGLAEWATLDLLRTLYGERWLRVPGAPPLSPFELYRAGAGGHQAAPGQPAYGFAAHEYAASVYRRTALILESVRRAHGATRFREALARYAQNGRFSHPDPAALFAAFDAVYGTGFAERNLAPPLLEGAYGGVRLVEVDTDAQAGGHRTTVRARREGSWALPTWLALYDARGQEMARFAWPADETTLHLTAHTSRPVARVAADPDRALLLDARAADQSRALRHHVSGPDWIAWWLGTVQALLAGVGP